MKELTECRDDLEAARDWLRDNDLDEALEEVGRQGGQTINRSQVAHAPGTSNAEFVGALFALLGIETVARMAAMARDGQLDSDEATAMVASVGGALTAAQRCLTKRDPEGAQRFIEAAIDILEV